MEEDLEFNDFDRFENLSEDEKLSEEEYRKLYATLGAAMEVYNTIGRGMEEPIYQECLELEFKAQGIPAVPQAELRTWYKGELLAKKYYADFITYGTIVVELKSKSRIISEHRSQLFNYLRITKQRCGLLVNYGDTYFYAERYLYLPSIDDFVLLRKENLDIFVSRKRKSGGTVEK